MAVTKQATTAGTMAEMSLPMPLAQAQIRVETGTHVACKCICFGPMKTESDFQNSCGDLGHLARQCPTAPSSGGGCFNCGQEGHTKADCTNERVARPFSGTCRLCQVEGHTARDCPTKPAEKCRNCGKEGG